jgi:hypothetical protein
MSIKRLLPCFIIVLLILPTVAFSQTEEIKEYRIKKGDTLWDISNKELQDPFLWPKIWKENPEVNNPDRIYPDQSIRIPLYLIQKQIKEEPVIESAPEPIVELAPEPVKKEVVAEPPLKPLVNKNVYLASGYIANALDTIGMITGSPGGKTLFGNNDLVYVKGKNPFAIGDKFYVVRKGQAVTHPATGQDMGYIIEILGVAEISKFEYGETLASILISFKEIVSGDLLDTFEVMEPPVVLKPFRKPNIEGYIVAAQDMRLMNSHYDIVYIDKGQQDGLQTGDILTTLAVGAHKVPNGTLQIIRLKDSTATALIVSGTNAVMAGNLIVQAE